MTREEAKKLLPIIQAFAEGKVIEIFDDEIGWVKKENPKFNLNPDFYRIKPQPKYRPFKNQEGCWNEMLKHQPFGWIKSKKSGSHFSIGSVLWNNDFNDVFVTFAFGGMLGRSSKSVFKDFTFADGTPFGIREEQL